MYENSWKNFDIDIDTNKLYAVCLKKNEITLFGKKNGIIK